MAFRRFRYYSADELHACGQVFVKKFSCERGDATRDTTERVMQFFAAAASPHARVYGCNGRPELMVDQCHISYPPQVAARPSLSDWDDILARPVRLHLALESEWGNAQSISISLVEVLKDAQKLALVRAEVKVLLFATRMWDDREQFVGRIKKIRLATQDESPWLWIDVSWHVCASRPPVYDVITA